MDQGRTRAQARAHGPGPDPGPMGQGHGPGPMDQAIISEAANAADFKGGCGGAEPHHMKKIKLFKAACIPPGFHLARFYII